MRLSPTLRAQCVKEFLCLLRDPRSRYVLIVPPLMQLLVFAFAATLDVRNVDLAVLDRDHGRWSHELVARIGAAAFVGRLHAVHDRAALHAAIDRREVVAALDIPETFSRDVAAGRTGRVQVIVDGRRANAGQITLGYLQRIAADLGAPETVTSSAAPAAVRHWFNPNLVYRWFVVPSLAGILSMFVALLVTALSIARERELGTFDQLLVSPATPLEIIVAKTVPALVIGTALGLLMVTAGVVGFGIPFTGSFALLLPCLVLFILSVVGIGLMVSSICATQQQAILGTFAVGVPMVIMSGFATPVENMPPVLQGLAQAIPLKHFLVIVQGCFVKALPAADVFANAWPMLVIAVVTLGLSTVFVRARLGA
ncbi:MAG: ABC transporter permease [Gammaproteobacteria bacterium]|nr:ABC transporter permease [Gammaproteobacteria bacterium]MCP5199913.1 ABC transporter permease [Gammaproteobacteria bacterium]